jgi:hypothetical protein
MATVAEETLSSPLWREWPSLQIEGERTLATESWCSLTVANALSGESCGSRQEKNGHGDCPGRGFSESSLRDEALRVGQ